MIPSLERRGKAQTPIERGTTSPGAFPSGLSVWNLYRKMCIWKDARWCVFSSEPVG